MNDYTWLNNRNKVYSVLASNDGRRFSGIRGHLGEYIILDVYIEDGE
jgi:hypothetical protein